MMTNNSGGVLRKYLTRVLAAGALLAIYAVSTLAVSGVFLTSTTTEAQAQRGARTWSRTGPWAWTGSRTGLLSWRPLGRPALPPSVEQPPLLLLLSRQSGLKFTAGRASGRLSFCRVNTD